MERRFGEGASPVRLGRHQALGLDAIKHQGFPVFSTARVVVLLHGGGQCFNGDLDGLGQIVQILGHDGGLVAANAQAVVRNA